MGEEPFRERVERLRDAGLGGTQAAAVLARMFDDLQCQIEALKPATSPCAPCAEYADLKRERDALRERLAKVEKAASALHEHTGLIKMSSATIGGIYKDLHKAWLDLGVLLQEKHDG